MTTPKATSISSVQAIKGPAGRVLAELKEVVEVITGRRPKVDKLTHLPSNATTADLIVKVNDIIDRIQP